MLYMKRFGKYTVYEQLSIFSKGNSVIDIFCSLVEQKFLNEIIYFTGNIIYKLKVFVLSISFFPDKSCSNFIIDNVFI